MTDTRATSNPKLRHNGKPPRDHRPKPPPGQRGRPEAHANKRTYLRPLPSRDLWRWWREWPQTTAELRTAPNVKVQRTGLHTGRVRTP